MTGLLVFVEGVHNGSVIARFMQVLEGPEDEVKTTYEKITKDKRHHNVCTLAAGSIAKRSFEGWGMKFEKINLNAHPALFDFFTLDQHLLQGTVFSNCDAALNFLKSF
ncbi:BLUF domain-containing protein [Mucilaginibacter psychrotolerans]|uniref:BLUF domain-containing protein n=1 Tax=Mucilaginibacter psychrotolerans TaxID=1524096 RepID=A0A4Y8SBX1_9SPHI|nr:BLUF domain-containing protein [Mucilaginibacter psychrotolerans]TFF36593.1 BLUF domain-containing protein [Mucilaginibacter psychrotolerans]